MLELPIIDVLPTPNGNWPIKHAAHRPRLTGSGHRTWLRIPENWPWATDLVNAYARLTQLPQPFI
jgi:hypothetical protein